MTTPVVYIHGYALNLASRDIAIRLNLPATHQSGIVALYVRDTEQWVIKATNNLRQRLLGVYGGDVGVALKRAYGDEALQHVDVYYTNRLGFYLCEVALGAEKLFCPLASARRARRNSTERAQESNRAFLLKHMGPDLSPEDRWNFIGKRGEEPHPFHKAVDALLSNVSSIAYSQPIEKDAVDKVKIKTIVARHCGWQRAMVAIMGDLNGIALLDPRFITIGEYIKADDPTLGIRVLEVMLDGNPDLDAEVMETMRTLAGVMVTAGYELRMTVEQDVDSIPMLLYVNEAMPVQTVLLAECAMAAANKPGVPDIFKRYKTKEFTDV